MAQAPRRPVDVHRRLLEHKRHGLQPLGVRPAGELVALALDLRVGRGHRRVDEGEDRPRARLQQLPQLADVGREPEGDLHPGLPRRVLPGAVGLQDARVQAAAHEVERERERLLADVGRHLAARVAQVGLRPVADGRAVDAPERRDQHGVLGDGRVVLGQARRVDALEAQVVRGLDDDGGAGADELGDPLRRARPGHGRTLPCVQNPPATGLAPRPRVPILCTSHIRRAQLWRRCPAEARRRAPSWYAMTSAPLPARAATEHVDVLIVGAGISGIGAAHHLQTAHPERSYAILEARERLGGTWDLFRYPGIRSDSDLHTFGYAFKPWTGRKAIADGPSILDYIRETAEQDGSDRHIRYGQRVTRAAWSSPDARWTVTVEPADGSRAVRDDGPLAVLRQRLLPLRRGLHAASGGHRSLPGPGHPPAALARGPRLRRQARARPGLRGDGRDARPRADRPGGARDDAPALPHLRPPGARAGRAGQQAARAARRGARLPDRPAQEHLPPARRVRAVQAPPEGRAAAHPLGQRQAARGLRLRRRRALQAEVRPVGPAPVRGAGRGPLQGDPRGHGVRGHRHRRHVHRDGRAPGLGPRARGGHRHHRDGAEPAHLRRDRARGRRRRRGAAGDRRLQGAHAQRRAELHLRHRLHELVLDAQGRPRVRVLQPAPEPPRPDGARRRRGRGHRPGHAAHPAAGLRGGLRPAVAARAAQAGRAGPVAPGDGLRQGRALPARGPDRRRAHAVLLGLRRGGGRRASAPVAA